MWPSVQIRIISLAFKPPLPPWILRNTAPAIVSVTKTSILVRHARHNADGMHVLNLAAQHINDHPIRLEQRLALKIGRDHIHSILGATAPWGRREERGESGEEQ